LSVLNSGEAAFLKEFYVIELHDNLRKKFNKKIYYIERINKILLFGTDGIRGKANTYPMTPEIALQAGRALVSFLREEIKVARPRIVIGRDTRMSGPMLSSATMAGICSMGGDVIDVGIIPTPGVAYLTQSEGAHAGIVISASHNPYADNGIKFFKSSGYKFSDKEESELEALILDADLQRFAESIQDTGQIKTLNESVERYIRFLQKTFQLSSECKRVKLVLDCSNGATSHIAPALFESLGFSIKALFNRPNGKNINAGCGSQHPEKMAEAVVNDQADLGLAFDGDGDRLIAVDEKGGILTGDQIIAVCALFLNKHGQLRNQTVVSTIMSNIGLGIALKREGIEHVMSDVGDRYVMEQMLTSNAILGGEDSGHIIFLDHHTTGDGMLAALQLIQVMIEAGKPLSELAQVMTVFPQVLINVTVSSKPDLNTIPEIQAIIQSVEKKRDGAGRVLVRYSGTQPMCRVMVEAPTDDLAETYCKQIAEVISKNIGRPSQ
jgi:phosphoglucosamine mutase